MPADIHAAYLDLLHRTEWLDPAALAEWQLPQIERMVRHAAASVPLQAARLAPLLPGGRFAPEAWEDMAPMTRADAQAAGEALLATSVPPQAGATHRIQTSGSTGTPLRFATSDLALTATRLQLERFWDWHGIDTGGRFADIHAYAEPPPTSEPTPPRPWSFRGPAGQSATIDAALPAAAIVDWLVAWRPDYLLCYPTLAADLAGAARAAGRAVPLGAVVTGGEVLRGDARDAIAAGFAGRGGPARVLDTYGCEEMGKLALACPAGRYHVCAESVLLEIVDDAGRPVGPGAEGWVVLTSLHNFATPFVRYRIGDRAVAGSAPCPCGRSLPVLDAVLGRTRNMLTLPDGRRLWPTGDMALAWRDFVPFRQFRVIQHAPDRLELRYVPDPGAPPPDPAGLAAHVRGTLHPAVTVALVPVAAIPRGPGGKFEDYVSLVA